MDNCARIIFSSNATCTSPYEHHNIIFECDFDISTVHYYVTTLDRILQRLMIIIIISTTHIIVHQNVPEHYIVYGNNVRQKGIVETLDYLLKTELISVLVHTFCFRAHV